MNLHCWHLNNAACSFTSCWQLICSRELRKEICLLLYPIREEILQQSKRESITQQVFKHVNKQRKEEKAGAAA